MQIVVLVRAPLSDPHSPGALEQPSPGDRAAVEAARHLAAEVGQGATTTAVTVSPLASDPALTWALARGIHKAIRVWGPDLEGKPEQDRSVIAELLAQTLRHIGFDVAFAGDHSANHATGLTGPAVARALEIPFVCALTDISPAEGQPSRLRFTSTHGQTRVTLAATPPLLCTVKGTWPLGPAEPATGRPKHPIIQLSLDDLEFDAGTAVSVLKRPALRPADHAAQMLSNVDELCEQLIPFGVKLA